MVERLFLDRIDTESAGSPISREHNLVVLSRPYEAEPLLSFMEFAEARTEVALDASIVQFVPVCGRCDGSHEKHQDWLAMLEPMLAL
jgi:hypothetical protein